MKCVEAVKTEGCLRAIESRGKPAGAQKLSVLMDEPVHPTVTEIDRNVMNSRCVENTEVCRTRGWKRTWRAAVPELDTETEVLKAVRNKKPAVPNLHVWLNGADQMKKN